MQENEMENIPNNGIRNFSDANFPEKLFRSGPDFSVTVASST